MFRPHVDEMPENVTEDRWKHVEAMVYHIELECDGLRNFFLDLLYLSVPVVRMLYRRDRQLMQIIIVDPWNTISVQQFFGKGRSAASTSIVLHNSAVGHPSTTVRTLLDRWNGETLEHHAYSPDISPCDFDLFPKMKALLRDKRFPDEAFIIVAQGRSLRGTNRNYAADGVHKLPEVWKRAVLEAGDCYEGM